LNQERFGLDPIEALPSRKKSQRRSSSNFETLSTIRGANKSEQDNPITRP